MLESAGVPPARFDRRAERILSWSAGDRVWDTTGHPWRTPRQYWMTSSSRETLITSSARMVTSRRFSRIPSPRDWRT